MIQRLAWSGPERDGKPREDPRLLARFACYLYAAGGAVILLTLPLPSHPDQNDFGLLILALLALASSVVVLVGFDRLGLRAFQGAAALGTLVITLAIYFRGDAEGPYALFFVWPILFSFSFFRRRAAFVQLGLVAVAYGILERIGDAGSYVTLYWVLLVASLGVAGVLVSLVTDRLERVWERERAQAKTLEQSEKRFRTLVANIPGAVYRCALDEEWTMEFVSDEIEEISGFPASDFIGNRVRSFASIIHPEDAGTAPVEEAIATGRPFALEYRLVHKRGEVRWVLERGQATTSLDGVVTLDGAIFDITDRRRVEDELREAETKFRTLVEQLPLITYIDALDAHSSNLYSSPQTEAVLGYSQEEWLADADLFPKLLHPADRDRVLAEHAKSHASGEPLKTEYRLFARDGRIVWIQDEAVVVRDGEGHPLFLQGFMLDITSRKEVDLMRHRLATIVESSDDAIFSGDTDGIVLSWNLGAERMYGYSAEEIVGESVAMLIPPDRSPEMPRILERVRRGESVQFETVRLRKDGSAMDVSLTVSPIVDEEGTVVGASGIQRDITDRKRAEEALRQKTASVELLHSLAVAANEATTFESAMEDSLGRICAYMGWPVGHVYVADDGNLFSTQLWHLDDEERFKGFREVTERTRFTPGVGLPGRVLDSGRATWIREVSADTNFLRLEQAEGAGIRGALAFPVLVGHEVAAVLEFFSLEAAEPDEALLEVMANLGAQLGRVVERTRAERALSQQNEQLRELDRMKDEFVALVSHELRTPLTSIRGYVQLLLTGRAGAVPDGQQRFLKILDRNADRLLRLVSDLLFFTQSAAGKLALEVGQVDLAELLSELVEAASPAAEEKGIALTLSADDAPVVVADRARLGQLVDNLLSNALKFTPEGGRVEVSAERENGQVAVSVSDSGIGIEAADQKGVFQRFFRAASATDLAIPGTGLGLAISKAIAEAHGGTIAVESELGAGATFRVELPATGATSLHSEVTA